MEDEPSITKNKAMNTKKLVSVILPALNEEEGIGETIKAIPKEELENMNYEYEVIVVDGNSKDRTREIAESLGARVIIEERKGYGLAIRTGFDSARGDILIASDADHSYKLEDLPILLKYFEDNNLDFLSTNRFKKMEKDAMSLRNKIGNWILTFTMNVLFGTPFKDSQTGVYMINKYSWHLIKPKITRNDWCFPQEIKIESHLNNLKCGEHEITFHKRKGKEKLNAWVDGTIIFLGLFEKKFQKLFFNQ
ncbi:MAG: glycosyltransferase family 2 protein [Candidatus Micrarchaeota archaeon]|nr:glycosyltransferase family 2 protein [Candidatus Micrarchaeota archaeon]